MSALSNERIQIDKLDAAINQLKTSIKLWFCDEDPVSAHSLAYAAYNVIDDITKARNPNRISLLFDSTLVSQSDRELLNSVFRRAGNFFKHADRDPFAKISFSPNETRILLTFAIYALECEGEHLPHEIIIFQSWLFLHNPRLRSEVGRKKFTDSFLIKYASLRTMPQREFFELLLESMKQQSAA